MFYIRTADRLVRTARWIEGFEGGIEVRSLCSFLDFQKLTFSRFQKLKRIIIDDELGICADLDREMDALVGTYVDEWAVAVADPKIRQSFRQFANTVRSSSLSFNDFADLFEQDERRPPAIENIVERGQIRPADWPKTFPSQKFEEKDLPSPRADWKWIQLATVNDLAPTDLNTTFVLFST